MPVCLLAILLSFCFIGSLSAQPGVDLVETQGFTSALHRANVSRIIFTQKAIDPAQLKPTDFLNTYKLTNKSNLFITVFMGNSLTNYLHQLAPDLPSEVLTKTGGYQFNFYVDDRLVYQSNLHPGAPYAAVKNKETIITKPLINNQREGAWWSQSAWNRFMNNGGDSTLTDGRHRLKMEIRPYLQQTDLTVGAVIAGGQLNVLVNRKPRIDLNTIRLTTPKPYPGFVISAEPFDRDKIKALKGNIDEAVFKHITSVIVIKAGKLLIEEYFNGATRDSLHDVRSVGKSFASTAAGIALGEGYLKSDQQSLDEFYNLQDFANYSSRKDSTTLQDLLTMSAALEGNDDKGESAGNEENMYPAANWVKFTLDLPVDSVGTPKEWHYFTAGVILLGDIIDKNVPGGLERYTDVKLFQPLGITRYSWQYTPQKVANTAGGIRMNALDLAKYGQLYKNGGLWNGKQLIPKAWVQKTFTPHKVIPGRSNEYYGYLFWNRTYRVNGQAYETYYCAGNGGNKIYVFKDQPLVVVVTATAFGTSYAHAQVDKMMVEYILPATQRPQ